LFWGSLPARFDPVVFGSGRLLRFRLRKSKPANEFNTSLPRLAQPGGRGAFELDERNPGIGREPGQACWIKVDPWGFSARANGPDDATGSRSVGHSMQPRVGKTWPSSALAALE